MKKRAIIEVIGIIVVVILSPAFVYSPLLGLGICVAGWLANEFADVDKKYPIRIKSQKLPAHIIATIEKLPTHLIASIGLNIILAITLYIVD